MEGFESDIFDAKSCDSQSGAIPSVYTSNIQCPSAMIGRYVSIQQISGTSTSMNFCE